MNWLETRPRGVQYGIIDTLSLLSITTSLRLHSMFRVVVSGLLMNSLPETRPQVVQFDVIDVLSFLSITTPSRLYLIFAM